MISIFVYRFLEEEFMFCGYKVWFGVWGVSFIYVFLLLLILKSFFELFLLLKVLVGNLKNGGLCIGGNFLYEKVWVCI